MLYDMAGFPEGESGLWSYEDIHIGDYVTFLYGATAYNLYRVKAKFALNNPNLPPPNWKPIEGRHGPRYFPFRLSLERIKIFQDSIAKETYKSVAENLLRRGGYRRSHFQADQYTLRSVSSIDGVLKYDKQSLSLNEFEQFEPKYVLTGADNRIIFNLRETILQSLIRQWLKLKSNRQKLFGRSGLEWLTESGLEVIGERALPEGYADILIQSGVKESPYAIFEVKMGKSKEEDFSQLSNYLDVMNIEGCAGFIISKKATDETHHSQTPIRQIIYRFEQPIKSPMTSSELLRNLYLELQK
jgi:hypothetical protein